MALALTWGGFADTDLRISEYFHKDHTVMIRFMPQYPNGYAGPLIGETGAMTYVIGQGRGDGTHTRLTMQFGSRRQDFDANIVAGKWHHLAIVREGQFLTLHLNGTPFPNRLEFPAPSQQQMVDVKGTVRFGRRKAGKLVDDRQAQFYGLLDEVSVFTRPFTKTEVELAAAKQSPLTGDEPGLLAGWTFSKKKPSNMRLGRPLKLGPNASLVEPSASRNSSQDKELLPEPPSEFNAQLPLPMGTSWIVGQGYNGGPSHWDVAEFCLDLNLAGGSPGAQFPDGTAGAPVHACAEGKVERLLENDGVLEVGDGDGHNWFYGHLLVGSATQAGIGPGKSITKGQQLGAMGKTGTEGEHLHVAFGEIIPGSNPLAGVTIPAAFTKYQRFDTDDNGNGGWTSVGVGVPQLGQIIRRPRPIDLIDIGVHRKWAPLVAWQQDRLQEIKRFGRVTFGQPQPDQGDRPQPVGPRPGPA